MSNREAKIKTLHEEIESLPNSLENHTKVMELRAELLRVRSDFIRREQTKLFASREFRSVAAEIMRLKALLLVAHDGWFDTSAWLVDDTPLGTFPADKVMAEARQILKVRD